MHPKTLLSAVLTAALLIPAAAFADHDDDDDDRRRQWDSHRHHSSCNHAPLPAPPPASSAPQGRYELQTVNQWVEGHYVRDWVPEQCVTKHKRRKKVTTCHQGYYADRWVDGYYQPVQQWVWVPAPRPHVRVTMRF